MTAAFEKHRPGEWCGEFVGQFLLCREQRHVFDGWRTRSAVGWHLHAHSSLGVCEVVGPKGEEAGWLVGYPVDSARAAIQVGPWRLACTPSPININEIERQLYTLSGRYILVLLTEEMGRLYLDPCGSLSVLYSVVDRVVGSTAEVLRDEEQADADLLKCIASIREGASGTWYPCGLTPWRNLRVLPPNHFLDLNDWSVRRHWPTCAPALVSNRGQCMDVVEEIAARITRNIQAVVETYPTVMSLTAGRDTRMLLACVRKMVNEILFVTLAAYPVDLEVAKLIAYLFRLKHIVGDTGFPERVLLQGVGGEIGRAFYWRHSDKATTRLTGRSLAERMHYPSGMAVFEHELEQWLNELGAHTSFFILDLAYIEQRLAMAHAPAEYEHDGRSGRFGVYPFNDRRTIELMLSLPANYRRDQQLCEDICRICWPSLRLLPINSTHFTGFRKYRMWWERRRLAVAWTSEQKRVLRGIISRNRSLPRMISDDISSRVGKCRRR